MSDVYLGGKFVGIIDDAKKFVSDLKEQRRTNLLSGNVNFYHDEKSDAVHVEAFRGRLRRPLVVVKDSVPMLTAEHERKLERRELKWSDLVNQGIIEYLDAAEEENAYVAFFESELTPEHTHLEVSPLAMFGLTTSLVPFTNYNFLFAWTWTLTCFTIRRCLLLSL
jgi:DNA-directed RNA polymerase beta subunit